MEPVKIGLIGCGGFGESHLQAYRAVTGAEVVALFDIDAGRARQMAEQFGVPTVCSSQEELCALPEVQVVDVVTPEAAHQDAVLTAFQHGKHVFVEKPLATDLAECDQMIDAADQAGRFFMVGHILRFETKYAMLKEEIESGRLGRVVSMFARRNRPKSDLPLYGRVHPALESCIHDLDLMLWYVNEPVRRVRGYARNATGSQNPDTFWGVLEFEGGTIAVVETIWLLTDAAGISLDDSFQLFGTAGVANLQLAPGSLSFWREGGFHLPDVSYDPRVMDSARGALREELDYFSRCVREGQRPALNRGIDGRRAVQVARALIESSEIERDVEIEDW